MKARGLEPNIAKMSDAEVDAFLREAGIDPDKELARAMELIAEHERKSAPAKADNCPGCCMCGPTCANCEDAEPDGTACPKCGRVQHVHAICDGTGKLPPIEDAHP